MKNEKQIAVAKPQKINKVAPVAIVQGDESSTFITMALANNAPIETLEKLFALHEKVKAEKARGEYVVAISQFQADCPMIEKTKKVIGKDGKLRYQYAPLEAIVNGIKKILAEHKLSYRWEVENIPGFIKATAIITHESGHQESSSFQIPIDNESYMTAPQKYASALTFAKRYSFTNVLGISTGDEDVDATDQHKEPEAKSPKSRIVMLMRLLGVDPNSTLPEFQAAAMDLAQLPLEEKNYSEIIARLTLKVQEMQEQDNFQEK